jgi:hypothetical protein
MAIISRVLAEVERQLPAYGHFDLCLPGPTQLMLLGAFFWPLYVAILAGTISQFVIKNKKVTLILNYCLLWFLGCYILYGLIFACAPAISLVDRWQMQNPATIQ